MESQLVATSLVLTTVVVRLPVAGAPLAATVPVPTAAAFTGLAESTPKYSRAAMYVLCVELPARVIVMVRALPPEALVVSKTCAQRSVELGATPHDVGPRTEV